PLLYQPDAAGKTQPVAGQMVMLGPDEVGFQVSGAIDPTRELVIDPVLAFSSYLGGSGDDQAYGIGVDAAGNSYVAGQTVSMDFPSANGYLPAFFSISSGFVAKLNAQGSGLVYSTFLGGTETGGIP